MGSVGLLYINRWVLIWQTGGITFHTPLMIFPNVETSKDKEKKKILMADVYASSTKTDAHLMRLKSGLIRF